MFFELDSFFGWSFVVFLFGGGWRGEKERKREGGVRFKKDIHFRTLSKINKNNKNQLLLLWSVWSFFYKTEKSLFRKIESSFSFLFSGVLLEPTFYTFFWEVAKNSKKARQ